MPPDAAMKHELVQSSVIRSIGYDERVGTLEIEFHSGRKYRYFEVSAFLHRGFILARSHGEYFNTRINNRFRFEEVLADDVSRTGPG